MSAIERAREWLNNGFTRPTVPTDIITALISECGEIKTAYNKLCDESRWQGAELCEANKRIAELEINAAIDHEAIDKHRNRIAELEEEVDALNDEIDGWKGIKKVTAADCAEIAESWECEANQNCEGYISNMIKQKYGV